LVPDRPVRFRRVVSRIRRHSALSVPRLTFIFTILPLAKNGTKTTIRAGGASFPNPLYRAYKKKKKKL
jgi:ABC-type phosphate transport system substrate-binding protein